MKITIKTLKQEAFHIEVEETDTVRMLKEKFFKESKDYPVERQRLIYLGKIMEDDDVLKDYNLDEKKFVVVMNKKVTTAPADTAAPAASASAASSGASATTTSASSGEKTTAAKSESGTAGASSDKPKEESTATTTATPKPEATEQSRTEDAQDDIAVKVQRIKEMGYSEQEARIALEICDNNPDRAVEYLLSEIATSSMGGIGGGGGLGEVTVGSGGGGGGGESQESRLAFLRRHPTFIEMKGLLQEDPSLLSHLLQRIQSDNPELMRIISENQQEFLALINEGADEGQSGGGGGGGGGGVGIPRGLESTAAAMVDSLTQSDMDAIDRLKQLGYPEHLVIQAYIACERNEYQAAEFLVSLNPDDDD